MPGWCKHLVDETKTVENRISFTQTSLTYQFLRDSVRI
jgi:hypothetical protein